MQTTKIVYIGAGSVDFGLNVLKDIFTCDELKNSQLSLVDINQENLNRMYNLAEIMNKESGLDLKIEKTSNRREVLPGAEFVINSIAIKRNELWKEDFRVPKKYGIRHSLGENGGPGGLFFTMRTIPMILDIVRDMEELCPDAYFLNFSNPESRVILAVNRYSSIKAIGLCHGVFMGRYDVSKILGMNDQRIDVWAAGLNHFQWFLELREKGSNKDLYPLFKKKEIKYDSTFMPLSRKLYRTFGYYPSCSDDHIGEYLPYGWEGGEEGYDFDGAENRRNRIIGEIEEKISGAKSVKEWLKPSGEKAVEVITAILYNKKKFIESGIVYNQGKHIANLPADLAVEVPIMVDRGGIHPISIGELPTGIKNLCQLQVGYQQMAVDAAANGSRELAYQALLVDPVINDTEAARKILDELWETNKPYIRKCI